LESEDLFYLGQELASKSPTKPVSTEAKLRSAISRAYYAVFLKARSFIDEHTTLRVPKDPTGHEFVRNIFRGSEDGKWKKIAYALDKLIEKRTKADYGDQIANISAEVEFSLLKAEETLNWLNELIQKENVKKRK
jgi:uncharacterized protein (UPF0332 family)